MAYQKAYIDTYSGGLNTNDLPWELYSEGNVPQPPPDLMQFPAISNLLLIKPGRMVGRGGQHQMIPSQSAAGHGFYQFRNTYTARLMLAVGTGLYAWSTDPAVNAVMVNAPAAPPTLAAGAAGNLTGTYSYFYSYVDVSGAESAPSPVASVVLSTQQANLTAIGVSASPTVVSRKIYRTTALSPVPAAHVGTIADNTTATYTDNLADTGISVADQYSYSGGSPIYTSLNATNEVNFAQMYDNLFLTDGSTTPQKWDGTTLRTYRIGMVPPSTAPTTTGAFDTGNLWGFGTLAAINGNIFSANITTGDITVKVYMPGGTGPMQPVGGLTIGANGNLYGSANTDGAFGFGCFFAFDPVNSILTTLYSFTGGAADGSAPSGPLCLGVDGNYYGVCLAGGTAGFGTIWRLSPSGNFLKLYDFTDANHDRSPGITAGLIQASDGNFYGTTAGSGAAGDGGNIFKITPAGAYTNLHDFTANAATEGYNPVVSLVQNTADGLLYGTCHKGAGSSKGGAFKISTAGTFTFLHAFTGGADGDTPEARLIVGLDGKLYGTTKLGGTNSTGTIYSMTTTGTVAVLHSFLATGTDGNQPSSGLYQDPITGTLYGVTVQGGTGASFDGVFYSIAPAGTGYTILHSFTYWEGLQAYCELIPGPGNLNSNTTLPGASGLLPYQYFVTFVNNQGTESNPSPASASLTVLYQAVALTNVPVSSDPQVTKRNIYRIGGTSSSYRYVGTINDNTTTIYTDDTPDIDLSTTTLSFAHDVPPDGIKYFWGDSTRLYAWGNPQAPYRLYFSSYQFPEYWPTILETPSIDGGFFDVNPSFNDGIVALGRTGSARIILNTYSAYTLLGDSLEASGDGFTLQRIAGARGCIARKSVVSGCGDSDECIYLGNDGQVYSITGGGYGRISQDIEASLRDIPQAYLGGAYAVYVDLAYHLFIPVANGAVQGYRLDTRTKTWIDLSDTVLLGQVATSTPGSGVGGEIWFETAPGYLWSGVSYNGIVAALSPSDTASNIYINWLSPEFQYGQGSMTNRARRLRVEGTVTLWDDTDKLRGVVNAITPDESTITHSYKCLRDNGVILDTDVHSDLVGQRLQIGLYGNVKTIEIRSIFFYFSPDLGDVPLTTP